MSTGRYELIGMSPRGLENWRSTPGQPEKREKWRQYRRKSPPTAIFTAAITAKVPISVAQLECPQPGR